MELREIDQAELRARYAPEPDDGGRLPGAYVADALRAQARVLGSTLRRTLVRQTCASLAPLTDEPDLGVRVDGILAVLLSLGDLIGPRGGPSTILSPAPLRAIPLGCGDDRSVLLVGGPPTASLNVVGEVTAPGLRVVRLRHAQLDGLHARITELGGLLCSLEAWTRRPAPISDAPWLERELARLAAEASPAPPLEEIRVYDPASDRPDRSRRWRRPRQVVAGAHLLRAQDERGRPCSGLGLFSEGQLRAFTRVADDLACELRFALDRRAGNPSEARFLAPDREDGPWRVEVPYLPRAEYRILRALSFHLTEEDRVPRVDSRDVDCLMGVLAGRLGLRCLRVRNPDGGG